jgi:hypothetical protein
MEVLVTLEEQGSDGKEQVVYLSKNEAEKILAKFEDYATVEYELGNWKTDTVRSRRLHLSRFLDYLKNGSKARVFLDDNGDLQVDSFDHETAKDFQRYLLSQGLSPVTANMTFRFVKELGKHCYNADKLSETLKGVTKLKETTTAERAILSYDEGVQMVKQTVLDLTAHGICLLAHGAGLRRGAIAGLLRGNVFVQDTTDGLHKLVGIFIPGRIGKNGVEYSTSIFGHTALFVEWLRKRDEKHGDDPEAPLIPMQRKGKLTHYTPENISKIYKDMLGKVFGASYSLSKKEGGYTLHDGRRWGGTAFYFKTGEIFECAMFMGHKKKDGSPNIDQTAQYINLANSWASLRMEKFAEIEF